MSWNIHISKLVSELGKTVGCMYKLSDLVPLWLKKAIYYAHFYSRLSYCALVWAKTSAQNLNKLETLQKKVLRIFEKFYGLPSELRTHQLFINHDLIRASDLYTYKLILYIQKNKLHQHSIDSSCRYALRNQLRPVPFSRTRYGECLLHHQIPTILNKFLTSIDFELPERIFKKHVRSMLLHA
uniref:Putative tick transposon n=1 Tax=Rhipicephalus microplus TaxID=6941 RepID=A0A6G5AG20_RHIMP